MINRLTPVFLPALLILAVSSCSGEAGKSGSPGKPVSFADLARRVEPSVVSIRATDGGGGVSVEFFRRFFGDQTPEEFAGVRLGSGIIIGAKGLILTNYHLVSDAGRVRVALGDDLWTAEVVKGDQGKDLALIRVKAGKKLRPAVLGRSRNLQVGEWVMAVGNPFGFSGNAVTVGVVSAVNRKDVAPRMKVGLIQTDASINPGNDGGPLLNASGEVVGIVTAAPEEGQGIGFAVPIDEARVVFEEYL